MTSQKSAQYRSPYSGSHEGGIVQPILASRVELRGTFTDPDMPRGYAPFGTRNIDSNLYVPYGKQDGKCHFRTFHGRRCQ
jgi:hypothetical protein